MIIDRVSSVIDHDPGHLDQCLPYVVILKERHPVINRLGKKHLGVLAEAVAEQVQRLDQKHLGLLVLARVQNIVIGLCHTQTVRSDIKSGISLLSPQIHRAECTCSQAVSHVEDIDRVLGLLSHLYISRISVLYQFFIEPLLRLHHKRKDQQQNKKNRAEEYDLQYILRLLLHTVRTPHKSDLPADNRYHKRQTGAVRTQS